MAEAEPIPGRAEPVERFRPTSGLVVGYLSLAAIACVLVYLALNERSLAGLRVGTGVAFFGVLVWATVLRPRVTAYPGHLRMHNAVRDVVVPYVVIDDVTVGRVLSVWVGDDRYVCTGIGASRRKAGGKAGSLLLGSTGVEAQPKGSVPARPVNSEMSYAAFVRTRITGLVEDARRRAGRHAGPGPADPAPEVRHVWAWPEAIALAGTGAAFVVALLL